MLDGVWRQEALGAGGRGPAGRRSLEPLRRQGLRGGGAAGRGHRGGGEGRGERRGGAALRRGGLGLLRRVPEPDADRGAQGPAGAGGGGDGHQEARGGAAAHGPRPGAGEAPGGERDVGDLVPGHPDGPGGGRRGLRGLQPLRQAAGELPVGLGPAAAVLQHPQDGTAAEGHAQNLQGQLAGGAPQGLVPLRLWAELHVLRLRAPPAEHCGAGLGRGAGGHCGGDEHGPASGGGGRAALHQRLRGQPRAPSPGVERLREGLPETGGGEESELQAAPGGLVLPRGGWEAHCGAWRLQAVGFQLLGFGGGGHLPAAGLGQEGRRLKLWALKQALTSGVFLRQMDLLLTYQWYRKLHRLRERRSQGIRGHV
mmetsp:Transcript_76338/g.182751  ORF Transcript_76338/g.182751 Transcript_76338/m.182751 type:complete len:368 (+) Transcript_76338:331-1434(+)